MTLKSDLPLAEIKAFASRGFADANAGRSPPSLSWRTGTLPYGGDRGTWGDPVPQGTFSFQVRLVTPTQKAYEAGFAVGQQHGTQADLEAVMTALQGTWGGRVGFSFLLGGLFDEDIGAPQTISVSLVSGQGEPVTTVQSLSLRSHGRDVTADQAAREPTLLFAAPTQRLLGVVSLRLQIDNGTPQDVRFD